MRIGSVSLKAMLQFRRPLLRSCCPASARLAAAAGGHLRPAAAVCRAVTPRTCNAGAARWKTACAAVSGRSLVLGIETSCDDTGAAVVTTDGQVLGEAIAHQAEIHAAWGGVVPNLAMEAHKEAIDRVVDQALARAGVSAADLDAVAVTVGPGLSLCLKVGVSKARQLSRQHNLPLLGVHHMEGHALVARLPPVAAATAVPVIDCTPGEGAATAVAANSSTGTSTSGSNGTATTATTTTSTNTTTTASGGTAAVVVSNPGQGTVPGGRETAEFPFLCLLVSGGHNLLLLVRGVGQYMQLGTTLDDALGEAYDKIARMLGLDLKPNGGAALEALARQGNPQAYKFAVPMRKHATCDFSYAGLKTSVRLAIEQAVREQQQQQLQQQQQEGGEGAASTSAPPTGDGACPLPIQVKADIAASFQYVACLHLTERVKRGVKWAREVVPDLSSLVVAGGVASNQYIRAQLNDLAASEGLSLVMPPPRWCTDNGVMIAWAGIERLKLGLIEHPAPPLGPTTSPAPHAEATQQPGTSTPSGSGPGGSSGNVAASGPTGPAAQSSSDQGAEGAAAAQEWVEVRPRWPLTSEYHPRRAPDPWNARKARMHTSLTDLTAAAVAAAAAAAPAASQPVGGAGSGP